MLPPLRIFNPWASTVGHIESSTSSGGRGTATTTPHPRLHLFTVFHSRFVVLAALHSHITGEGLIYSVHQQTELCGASVAPASPYHGGIFMITDTASLFTLHRHNDLFLIFFGSFSYTTFAMSYLHSNLHRTDTAKRHQRINIIRISQGTVEA